MCLPSTLISGRTFDNIFIRPTFCLSNTHKQLRLQNVGRCVFRLGLLGVTVTRQKENFASAVKPKKTDLKFSF